jgi:hypothetical protein
VLARGDDPPEPPRVALPPRRFSPAAILSPLLVSPLFTECWFVGGR